jgi:phosphatidylglycerol:prolipoprotein diacylglycerol transferase
MCVTTPLALIYKVRRLNISAHSFFMIFSPILPLGIGIGRLGCFVNGCCYGAPGQQAWCVTFPKGTLPFEAFGSTPLHPSQIYAFLLGLGLAFFLKTIPTIMPRIHGIHMAVILCLFYGMARLIEEAFRADTPKHFFGLLTAGQGTSVILILCAVVLWIPSRKLHAPSF